jgi:NAD(P)H-quinone oxidoreductase subunit 5
MGRIGLAMVAVSTMYFLLQVTMAWLLAGSVPAAAAPSLPMAIFMYATISLFAALSIAQACGLFMRAPGWMHDIFVHASNGFYVNAVFNHMTGALRIKPTKS